MKKDRPVAGKKTVRLWYSHDWIRDIDELYQILNLDSSVKLIYDDVCPQYLLAGERIFEHQGSFMQFIRLCQTPAIRIFFSLEAISPDFNIFDYAITNDLDLSYGNRAMRIRYAPMGEFFKDFDAPRDMAQARGWLKEKKHFCNFVYSNARAHPFRDDMFYRLSAYKPVHSLGRHLRNFESPDAQNAHFLGGSIAMKKPYKFSIACENATFKGYTTEKLLTSFQAKTIPIYWGNPEVAREYNPKAFINCHDYENFDQVLEEVKRIDQDDDLWCRMVSQPPCTKEQIIQRNEDRAALGAFVSDILTKDTDQILARPQGYWPMCFFRWFRAHSLEESKIRLFMRKAKYKTKWIMQSVMYRVRGGVNWLFFPASGSKEYICCA